MKLFVYCAGGFGREVFDVAKRMNAVTGAWDELCFIDDTPGMENPYYGATLVSFKDFIARYDLNEAEVVIANGEPAHRKTIYERLKAHGVKLGTVIDPSAIVVDTAKLGEGVILTSYCSVASLAEVGANVAVNVKAIIGHDCKIGEHCVVSSMVNVGGASTLGAGTYVGMGVQIKDVVSIGSETIVGMGSVVYSDIPDRVIALGNPARAMRENVDKRVFKSAKN